MHGAEVLQLERDHRRVVLPSRDVAGNVEGELSDRAAEVFGLFGVRNARREGEEERIESVIRQGEQGD